MSRENFYSNSNLENYQQEIKVETGSSMAYAQYYQSCRFHDDDDENSHQNFKRKLNEEINEKLVIDDDKKNDVKKPRKRGRPSYWSNLEYLQQKQLQELRQKQQIDGEQETITNLITPQLLVKRQRRLKANDRERNRMKNLNKTLQILKSLLPFDVNSTTNNDNNDDKLTKIETLRLATQYIYDLTQLLKLTEPTGSPSPSLSSTSTTIPSNLSSPALKEIQPKSMNNEFIENTIKNEPCCNEAAISSVSSSPTYLQSSTYSFNNHYNHDERLIQSNYISPHSYYHYQNSYNYAHGGNINNNNFYCSFY